MLTALVTEDGLPWGELTIRCTAVIKKMYKKVAHKEQNTIKDRENRHSAQLFDT